MSMTTTPATSLEVLEGAQAIAEFMGFEKRRAIYSAVESNSLPVFRMNKKICARKSTLRAFMANQEANANAPALLNRKAA